MALSNSIKNVACSKINMRNFCEANDLLAMKNIQVFSLCDFRVSVTTTKLF
jgi:hypothetical protein